MKLPEITLEYLLSRTTTTESGCMEWNGSRDPNGYGRVGERGKVTRIVLELMGHDMKGLLACHKCDNPPCINPDHLFPGTYLDNIIDAIKKGRRKEKQLADHGSVSFYTRRGCRCDKCRKAATDYAREHYDPQKRKKYYRYQKKEK